MTREIKNYKTREETKRIKEIKNIECVEQKKEDNKTFRKTKERDIKRNNNLMCRTKEGRQQDV